MIRADVLLDDGAITLSDVRCRAAPTEPAGEEVVDVAEINFPLAGTFVRSVRRAGRPAAARIAIGDPGRVMLFRRHEPYRVSHPVGGDDRTLVIALRRPPPAIDATKRDDRPISVVATVTARRLARALRFGLIDALSAGEQAMSLVDMIGLDIEPLRQPALERDRRLAGRIRLEISARLGERLTLPELGRAVGLSGWEAARRFRRATGTSIHAYRTHLRVHAALERIEAGEPDLTAIALDLGFADHSHMTNVVRRATGSPPSAFRFPLPTAVRSDLARTILQA